MPPWSRAQLSQTWIEAETTSRQTRMPFSWRKVTSTVRATGQACTSPGSRRPTKEGVPFDELPTRYEMQALTPRTSTETAMRPATMLLLQTWIRTIAVTGIWTTFPPMIPLPKTPTCAIGSACATGAVAISAAAVATNAADHLRLVVADESPGAGCASRTAAWLRCSSRCARPAVHRWPESPSGD